MQEVGGDNDCCNDCDLASTAQRKPATCCGLAVFLVSILLFALSWDTLEPTGDDTLRLALTLSLTLTRTRTLPLHCHPHPHPNPNRLSWDTLEPTGALRRINPNP